MKNDSENNGIAIVIGVLIGIVAVIMVFTMING